MALSDTTAGYLAVLGAILFFGSFGVPLKTKRVQEAKVDPVVFQMYYSISIFLSSWIVLAYNPFVFTYYGIVGASLWVPASILSIAAINFLGMSVAVGIWCGVTIVTSFLWGAIAFPSSSDVKSIPLSVVALGMLILGITGLSLSNTSIVKGKKSQGYTSINSGSGSLHREEAPLLPGEVDEKQKQQQEKTMKDVVLGMTCALILGVMNGSMMVPLRFTPEDASGINYIVSFGIGVMVVTPVCALVYFLIRRQLPQFHLKVALVPGLITGLIWNVGNFCSIYATLYLGLTVGFPLTQVALVVSGLWGILMFKELKGARTLVVWTLGVCVLLGGASLLALYG